MRIYTGNTSSLTKTKIIFKKRRVALVLKCSKSKQWLNCGILHEDIMSRSSSKKDCMERSLLPRDTVSLSGTREEFDCE